MMRLYLAFEEAVKFPSEVAEPLAIHSSSAGKSVIPHPQQHSLNATFTLRVHLLLLTDMFLTFFQMITCHLCYYKKWMGNGIKNYLKGQPKPYVTANCPVSYKSLILWVQSWENADSCSSMVLTCVCSDVSHHTPSRLSSLQWPQLAALSIITWIYLRESLLGLSVLPHWSTYLCFHQKLHYLISADL